MGALPFKKEMKMTVQYTQKQFDAGDIFSGKPSGTKVLGFDTPSEYTPALDLRYQFHESSRDVVVWFLMEKPEPLYLYGPSGSGKSSLIRQLGARLNYPIFEITGHDRLEIGDLIGHHTVQNGSMKFEYGPLAMAMKVGGIFQFNEIDLCSPATLAGLNTILDGSPLCIPENGGELIFPTETFRFVATANTNGSSDDTGLYQGTLRQNIAFLDRFMLVEVYYPQPHVEEAILANSFPSLPKKLISQMVNYANEVRKLFMGEFSSSSLNPMMMNSCEVTLSTRTLIRWADLTIRFQPLAQQGTQPISYALDRALGFRASKESRAMLHELAQRIFKINGQTENENLGE